MKRPVEEIQQRLKAPGSKQPPRESTAGESKCPTHLLHPITPSSRSTQAYDNRLLWHESAPNLRSRVDKEDSPKSYTLRKLRTIRRINSGCTSFARSGPECGRPLNPGSSVGKSLPGVPRSFCNVRSVGGTSGAESGPIISLTCSRSVLAAQTARGDPSVALQGRHRF